MSPRPPPPHRPDLVASLTIVVVMLATSLDRDPPELLPLLGVAVLAVAYGVARLSASRVRPPRTHA